MLQITEGEDSTFIYFSSQYSWEVGCIIYVICMGEFPFPTYPHISMQVPTLSFDAVSSRTLTPEFRQLLKRALDSSGETRVPFVDFFEQLHTIPFFV
mmetsp:Transcript_7101/g.10855  ORF Transcript_7101/g.10855 Transcript_7101/m.10855 type:complete len:97 (-) Transcript_7101:10-300(-)